jgi:hypothetical protein
MAESRKLDAERPTRVKCRKCAAVRGIVKSVWAIAFGVWGDALVWGDTLVWADTLIWRDTVVWGDTIIWADAIVWGDSTYNAQSQTWANLANVP